MKACDRCLTKRTAVKTGVVGFRDLPGNDFASPRWDESTQPHQMDLCSSCAADLDALAQSFFAKDSQP